MDNKRNFNGKQDVISGNILMNALHNIIDTDEAQAASPVAEEAEDVFSHVSEEPDKRTNALKSSDKGTVHFTFICDKSIVDKVKAICSKEGVTIRDFIEHLLLQGITSYESKHGEATAMKRSAADIF